MTIAERKPGSWSVPTLDKDTADWVCHELRRPLAVIDCHVELLQDGIPGALNAEQQSCLELVAKSSRKLNQLISDLYHGFEAVTGSIRPVHGACNLEQLLHDLAEEREADCRAAGVKLSTVTDGPLVHPRTDRARLKATLGRLVDNVLRFASQGRKLVLSLERLEDCARLEVRDRGPGIPERELPSLFHGFYRLDRDRRSTQGIGVGLTVCRATVLALGGDIWAENAPEGGTTIVVELPFEDQGVVRNDGSVGDRCEGGSNGKATAGQGERATGSGHRRAGQRVQACTTAARGVGRGA